MDILDTVVGVLGRGIVDLVSGNGRRARERTDAIRELASAERAEARAISEHAHATEHLARTLDQLGGTADKLYVVEADASHRELPAPTTSTADGDQN